VKREIGDIPKIANVRRRGRTLKSLKLFAETYCYPSLYHDWSKNQLRAIARIEEAVFQKLLFALAMERGSGKTTICRIAVLWAISNALCRYPFLIGATDTKAKESLDFVRTTIRFGTEYTADFPEIAFPAQCLQGIANRATGQTCNGESTLIDWSVDRIVLPTVPPPENWPKAWQLRDDGRVPTSGVLTSAAGLTGEGIRGSLKTLTTLEQVRPDLVLLDDPQTPESARSMTQNATRLQLVTADVLGMAGPGVGITGIMPCTVIEPGDMVDTILDRQKNPLWRGERTGILNAMPKLTPDLSAYFEVYARCMLKEPPDFTESNEHYQARQDALESGLEASWPDRKLSWEVSAVQHALHLYYRDPRGFAAEYMNRPTPPPEPGGPSRHLTPAVAKKLSGTPRFEVPRNATRLSAFIDVGKHLLWYAVVAWDERYNGTAIDYGCYPPQARTDFSASDPQPSIQQLHAGVPEDQAVYLALQTLAGRVLGRTYPRQDTNEPLTVGRCLIDRGWWPDVVMLFARREVAYRAVVLPSKGWGEKPSSRPMNSWPTRAGEQVGPNWRIGSAEHGKGRQVTVDVDKWKGFAFDRLVTGPGGSGCLDLFGDEAHAHAMFARHCAAERGFGVAVEDSGKKYEKWEKRQPGLDNHLWDCVVGCCVAASIQGLVWNPTGTPEPNVARSKRKLSERFAHKLANW
jgi:hypothetical protein